MQGENEGEKERVDKKIIRTQNWKCSAAIIIYYCIAKTKLLFASEMHLNRLPIRIHINSSAIFVFFFCRFLLAFSFLSFTYHVYPAKAIGKYWTDIDHSGVLWPLCVWMCVSAISNIRAVDLCVCMCVFEFEFEWLWPTECAFYVLPRTENWSTVNHSHFNGHGHGIAQRCIVSAVYDVCLSN